MEKSTIYWDSRPFRAIGRNPPKALFEADQDADDSHEYRCCRPSTGRGSHLTRHRAERKRRQMRRWRCLGAGVAAASAWFAAPVVAAPDPAVRAVYEACVSAAWPTSDDAEDRNRACSKALQMRMLAPREIARARVTRVMARVALGNRVLATDDYVEALRHYESAIDSKNPDALDLAHQAASLDGLGQTERALEVYAQAIKRDPQSGLAYLGRGRSVGEPQTRLRAGNRGLRQGHRLERPKRRGADRAWQRTGRTRPYWTSAGRPSARGYAVTGPRATICRAR